MDEWLIDRVAQPVADFLERWGVSYLAVARASIILSMAFYAAERLLAAIDASSDISAFVGGAFGGVLLAATWMFLIKPIERHAKKVESGTMLPPPERATYWIVRGIVLICMVFDIGIALVECWLPTAVLQRDFLCAIASVLEVAGVYLWVVRPPLPTINRSWASA